MLEFPVLLVDDDGGGDCQSCDGIGVDSRPWKLKWRCG
jgi:hypothetical protein